MSNTSSPEELLPRPDQPGPTILEARPIDPQPSSRGAGDAWILFLIVLILLPVAGVAQLVSRYGGLVFTEVVVILLAPLAYVWLKKLPIFESLRWRPVGSTMILRSAFLGASGWGMAVLLQTTAAPLIQKVLGPDPLSRFIVEFIPTTAAEWLVALVVMCVLPGVCEETLFRGALQGTLERKGPFRAVLYAGLAFAFFHLNPWMFLTYLALGVLFGVLTVRTGSIVPAMICHTCNNAMAITVALLAGPDTDIPTWVFAVAAVPFVVALAEFLISTRKVSPSPTPLALAPPRVPRWLTWTMAGLATAISAVVLVSIVLFCSLFDRFVVQSGALEPQIHTGDYLLVARSNAMRMSLAPGDIVSLKRGGQTHLRRVTRVEGDTIWIAEPEPGTQRSVDTELPRDAIRGKVVFNFSESQRMESGR